MHAFRPRLVTLGLAILAGISGISPCHADNYVGALLGPSFMNNSLGTQFLIAGHVGTKIQPNFGLGFYGSYESLSSSAAFTPGVTGVQGTVSGSAVVLAGEANLYPMEDQGFYIGGKLGVGLVSSTPAFTATGATTNVPSSTSANLAIGPDLGYNYPIASNTGLGAEANYMIVTTSGTLTAFNLLASLSYFF